MKYKKTETSLPIWWSFKQIQWTILDKNQTRLIHVDCNNKLVSQREN